MLVQFRSPIASPTQGHPRGPSQGLVYWRTSRCQTHPLASVHTGIRILTGPVPTRSPRTTPAARITPDLVHAAALRLVGQSQADTPLAAKRLVASAPSHGIDLTQTFATLNPDRSVRQACLVVLGAGRTAMLFLSEPPRGGDVGGAEVGVTERTACLDSACQWLKTERSQHVRIAQALPDPGADWSRAACAAASFVRVGELRYLRRPLAEKVAGDPVPSWPAGIDVRRLDEIPQASRDSMLLAALERTYEHTLDCPELCGLRETPDVLASHKAIGVFDPKMWWLAFLEGESHGCMLLSRCPEQRTIELVYLGLSPRLRGRGLAKLLMTHGLHRGRTVDPTASMTCAVDDRNTPARKLYESLGFREFSRRVAWVRAITP